MSQDARDWTEDELENAIKATGLLAAPAPTGDVGKRPVAWRVKDFADGWIVFHDEEAAYKEAERTGAVMQGLYARDGAALRQPPQPTGPYEARYCKDLPTHCCDYGIISHNTGKEVCRVWDRDDCERIAALLNGGQPTGDVGLTETEREFIASALSLAAAHRERGDKFIVGLADNINAMAGIIGRLNSRSPLPAWQPIETAPDNEGVLCFGETWKYPVVLMRTQVWVGPDGPHRMAWLDDSGDGDQNWNPTLWMRWPSLTVWHSINRRAALTGAGEEANAERV